MKVNYPNISYGYLGIANKDATLSSSFFMEITNGNYNFNQKQPFIQRVPKSGFFDELIMLESEEFKINFLNKIKEIKVNVEKLCETNNIKDMTIINWINLLLRLGESEFIITLDIPAVGDLELQLEFQLLKKQSEIEINLSKSEQLSLVSLIQFTDKIRSMDLSQKFIAYALSRVVVNGVRHNAIKDKRILKKYTEQIIELLNQLKDDSFEACILKSIIFRGISMVSEFGIAKQHEWLLLAEQYARSINYNTELEKIVMLDNLYTCLQTLSKWNMHRGNNLDAKQNLYEMISINPYDSTAYSELAMFFMKIEDYKLAAENFKRALELGPPGVGMNAFYYAKCLQLLGDKTNAIQMFYQCISFDDKAISPWLELFENYVNNLDFAEAKKVADIILNTKDLAEQLETDELQKFKAYNMLGNKL